MKILYVYDEPGWAIQKVGELWFDGLNGLTGIETNFCSFKNLPKIRTSRFDIIWYGYLGTFFKEIKPSQKPSFLHRIPPVKNIVALGRSVIAVHDPSELFPLSRQWQESGIGRKMRWILGNALGVVTVCKEMEEVLLRKKIKACTISTMSSLNPRDENDIVTNKCSAYAAYNPYPRKNSPLMEKLKSFCLDTLGISFEYKLGRILLSEKEYVSQLDSHEIYLCTSLQEGGPIPAMDAMVRGAVVLSTPVGQMPEIITNGENGFLCSSEDDFKRYLRLLADDHNQLQRLRLASRRKIVLLRNREEIQKNMLRFLQQLRTT